MGLERDRQADIVAAATPDGQATPDPDLIRWSRRAEGFLELPFGELSQLADGLDLIRRRVIDGLVVPDFYSRDAMEAVTERFWRAAPNTPHEAPFGRPPQVFCRPLTTTEDAAEYFGHAPILRELLVEVFGDLDPFEGRLEAAFAALGGGRPPQIPRGPAGQIYSPGTIRTLPPGHRFAPHFGNEFLFAPTCAHLRSLMRSEMHLSYFTPVAAPASGGELVLYDVEWSETNDGKMDVPLDVAVLFVERRVIALEPGELVIFDGSRILHAITPVGEGPIRVTLGGFLGFTADDRGVVYWS